MNQNITRAVEKLSILKLPSNRVGTSTSVDAVLANVNPIYMHMGQILQDLLFLWVSRNWIKNIVFLSYLMFRKLRRWRLIFRKKICGNFYSESLMFGFLCDHGLPAGVSLLIDALTYGGLVAPYEVGDLGQHLFRYCIVADDIKPLPEQMLTSHQQNSLAFILG